MAIGPLDAVSLAGAVVQMVEFTCKLIAKGNELYQSTDGALVEHRELDSVAQNLRSLSRRVEDSHSWVMRGKALKDLNPEERLLLQITSLCRNQAKELEGALKKLTLDSAPTRWKSFRQALKSILGKQKIHELHQKLSDSRSQLVLLLVVVLGSSSAEKLDEIKRDSDTIGTRITGLILDSTTLLQRDLTKLQQSVSLLSADGPQNLWRTFSREQHDQVSHATTRISAHVSKSMTAEGQMAFLDSLQFAQIKDRYRRIPKAHRATFHWAFEDDYSAETRMTNLGSWLEQDQNSRCFWIAGKPGSGKSMFMRFLYQERRTLKHLQKWAQTSPLLIGSYFLWTAGTDLQKSLTGLLRTLLHEMLEQCPEFMSKVAPWRYRNYILGARTLDEWTDSELLAGLRSLLEAVKNHSKVMLFVDGLDELHGSDDDRELLAALMLEFSTQSHVKVCVASRPWNVFEDVFGQGPRLRLEDLTRNDIRVFVNDGLGQHPRFKQLRRLNAQRCDELVQEIINKARGVFLWVFLVIKSLRDGLRNEDRISNLFTRLQQIPEDLELFFMQILSSIKPMYRQEASELFKTLIATGRSMPLLTVSFLREEDLEASVGMLRSDTNEYLARLNSTKRRVNAISRNLVESYSQPQVHNTVQSFAHSCEVDFIHRTVRDFMVLDSTWRILQKMSREPSVRHRRFCRAVTAQLQCMIQPQRRKRAFTRIEAANFIRVLARFDAYFRQFEIAKASKLLLRAIENALAAIVDVYRIDATSGTSAGYRSLAWGSGVFLGRPLRSEQSSMLAPIVKAGLCIAKLQWHFPAGPVPGWMHLLMHLICTIDDYAGPAWLNRVSLYKSMSQLLLEIETPNKHLNLASCQGRNHKMWSHFLELLYLLETGVSNSNVTDRQLLTKILYDVAEMVCTAMPIARPCARYFDRNGYFGFGLYLVFNPKQALRFQKRIETKFLAAFLPVHGRVVESRSSQVFWDPQHCEQVIDYFSLLEDTYGAESMAKLYFLDYFVTRPWLNYSYDSEGGVLLSDAFLEAVVPHTVTEFPDKFDGEAKMYLDVLWKAMMSQLHSGRNNAAGKHLPPYPCACIYRDSPRVTDSLYLPRSASNVLAGPWPIKPVLSHLLYAEKPKKVEWQQTPKQTQTALICAR